MRDVQHKASFLAATVAASIVVLLVSGLAIVRAGNPTAVLDVLDGGAWIANLGAPEPSIDHVNVSSGKVDLRASTDGNRAQMQRSSDGKVTVVTQGNVRFELDDRSAQWAVRAPSTGDVVSVSGKGVTYLLRADGTSVQYLATRASGPKTPSAALKPAAPFSTPAAVDGQGTLWLAGQSGAVVVPVVPRGTSAPLAKTAQLAVPKKRADAVERVEMAAAGDRAIAVVRFSDHAELTSMEVDKQPTSLLPASSWLSSDVKVHPDQRESDRLVVLEPSSGTVRLIDPRDTSRQLSLAIPSGRNGNDLQAPVVVGDTVLIPDQTTGEVILLDRTQRKSPQVVPVGDPGGGLEVVLGGGGAVVNAPTSRGVVTIDGNGTTKHGDKFVKVKAIEAPPAPTTTTTAGPDRAPTTLVGSEQVTSSARPGPQLPAAPVLEAPGEPIDLSAVAGKGEVRLSWQAGQVGGRPSGYVITDSSGRELASPGASESTAVIPATNGLPTALRIRAVNASGQSNDKPFESVTPQSKVPGVPREVVATAGDKQVTVGWKPAPANGTAIGAYVVTANGPTGSTTKDVPGNSVTAVVDALKNGVSYTFTVAAQAVIDGGDVAGDPSPPTAATTPFGPPLAPTGVTAAPGNASLSVTFSDAGKENGNAISSRELALFAGSSSAAVPPAGTPTSAASSPQMKTGLNNGQVYTAWVRATNAAGAGAWSAPTSTTPRTVPTVNLTAASSPGDRTIRGNFTVTANGSPATRCVLVVSGVEYAGGCGQIDVGGLAYSTTYSVHAYAENAAGRSPNSNTLSARTNDAPAPPSPSVSVSWDTTTNGGNKYIITTISNFPANQNVTMRCNEDSGYAFPSYTVSTFTGSHTYQKSGNQAVCYQNSGLSTWVTVTLGSTTYSSNKISY